jgi:hypothetical protein
MLKNAAKFNFSARSINQEKAVIDGGIKNGIKKMK